jgi:prepilin-type N-terminal cleavage/methylation domain-containing protein
MVTAALGSGTLETRRWSATSGGRRRYPGGKKESVLRSAKGMTLPEVLVALAFIAVFSAGMATLAVSLVRGSAKAKAMDTAVFLAHDRLEAIRNTPYANITAANFPAEAYGTIAVGSPPVAFPDHQRSVTIQDDTPNAGVKRVVVTVSWRDGSVSGEVLVGQ